MPEQYIQTRFETVCGEHDTWVVAYDSAAFGGPVFFVWYTDNKGGDKLLTLRNQEIFAVNGLEQLAARLTEQQGLLQLPTKVARWLSAISSLEPVAGNTYRVDRIARQIKSKKLSLDALDGLSNFIDLFGDYANSLKDTEHLQSFRDNPLIATLIQYYYHHIFWPRLNDQDKFSQHKRPELDIDHAGLLEVFTGMKQKMEAVIRVF